MAFFKIDPEKAKTQEGRLNEYGAFVSSQRSRIYKSSENNSHPVGTVEEAARAYGGTASAPRGPGPSSPDGSSTQPDSPGGDGSSSTLAGCASAIIGLATELNARRTEVVNLNSNGIDNKNPDGTYSYYLPDPPEGTTDTAAYWASMDTASNVRTYNSDSAVNGKKEAKELEAAINSGDQAKVNEILAQIDKHKDVPAYGAAFYKQCGGANQYLALVHDADQRFGNYPDSLRHIANTLGHILGGASQSGVGGDELGKEFAGTIKVSPNGDNVAIFNALTSAPGSSYGTKFLVDAATILVNVDAGLVGSGTGFLSLEFSKDPMAGVLAAMGNNSKAALTYLSGTGHTDADGNWVPDDIVKNRWKKLTSRDWKNYGPSNSPKSWCASGQDGFTSAIAAASAYRNADSAHSNPQSDARATYISANGITYFGGDGTIWGQKWSKDDFTDKMQKNMAVVLGNSPEELAGAASGQGMDNGDGGPGLQGVKYPNPNNPKDPYVMSANDISTLIYRFGNNKDALTTVSARVGKFHHDQTESTMETAGAGDQTLQDSYSNTAATMAYIEHLSNSRVADDMMSAKQAKTAQDAAVKAKQTEVVGTSLSILSTIAVAGVTVVSTGGSGAPLAATLLTTAAQPLATQTVVDMLGGVPDVDAGGSTATTASAGSTVNEYDELKAQRYSDVSNRGLFKNEPEHPGENTTDQNAKSKHPKWYSADKNGNPSVIETNKLTSKQIEEMMKWKQEVKVEDDKKLLNEIDTGVSNGMSNGQSHARSAAPLTN